MSEPTDGAWQLAVLLYVMELHPDRLSPEELPLAMTAGGEDADDYDRAVVALISFGLLRRDGDSIVPTYAALRFAALQD
jgi:hypothetical protein